MNGPGITDIYAAAHAVKRPAGTIRSWVHRGEITHHGYDKRGRVLVDVRELEKVNNEKKQKAEQAAA